MSLFAKKSLEVILAQTADSEKGLKRTLGAGNLIALGIGAIIGAGLFVRTAAAAGQAWPGASGRGPGSAGTGGAGPANSPHPLSAAQQGERAVPASVPPVV